MEKYQVPINYHSRKERRKEKQEHFILFFVIKIKILFKLFFSFCFCFILVLVLKSTQIEHNKVRVQGTQNGEFKTMGLTALNEVKDLTT